MKSVKTLKEREIIVNKVVNVNGTEITVLNSLFKYAGNFKGATGTMFEAVSKEVYEYETSRTSVIDRIKDCFTCEELKEKGGAAKLYRDMKNAGEIGAFLYDFSYTEIWPELRKHGFNEKDFPVFTCVGGGRMFDKNFRGNKNEYLHKYIRKIETPVITV